MSARAAALAASGVDVISFGAGEPDMPTPASIVSAAKTALDNGATRYTPVGGTNALKAAIRAHFLQSTGVEFSNAEILASCGAKHSLYNLFLALLDPGDEVIVPAPYWVSYPVQISMAGGKTVEVFAGADQGFLPSIDALEAAVTPRTRAIVINNPSNPTGAFWDESQLLEIVAWLRRHPSIVVISDAIYDSLVYDGLVYRELLALAPDLRSRYVLVNGVSKSFAMTGWRLGYTLAPRELIAAMTDLQSQSTSNPTSVTQSATIAALAEGEKVIAPMRQEFQRRRDIIYALLSAIPDVRIAKPRGAFYAFPDVSAYLGKSFNGKTIATDLELAEYLLEEGRVAVVHGEPFGAPGYIRLSYACSEREIRDGVQRISDCLARLR